jgi:hypothetical protein
MYSCLSSEYAGSSGLSSLYSGSLNVTLMGSLCSFLSCSALSSRVWLFLVALVGRPSLLLSSVLVVTFSVKSRSIVAGYARIGKSLSVLVHSLLYLCVPGVVVSLSCVRWV